MIYFVQTSELFTFTDVYMDVLKLYFVNVENQ